MASEIPAKGYGLCFGGSLGGRHPLTALPAEVQGELDGLCRLRRYAPGDVVVREGDRTAYIGCVRQGILRMQKTLADGREQIVGLLVDGDIFGRVYDGPLAFDIEAATATEICCFERVRFEALLARSPELERAVLLNLLNELDRARDWMMVLSNRKVTGRVAGFLVMLCTRFGSIDHVIEHGDGALEVTVPISRGDMAHLLGTRQESISRAVHALAASGVIAIRSPQVFAITDLTALLAEAGEGAGGSVRSVRELVQVMERRAV